MRRVLAIAGASLVVAVALLVVGGARTATAALAPQTGLFGNCPIWLGDLGLLPIACVDDPPVDAPTPRMPPGSVGAGLFDNTPAAGTSLYGKYGYSPLSWSLYRTPSPISDFGKNFGTATGSAIDNTIGGAMMGGAVDLVALANGLGRLIDPPTFLNSLDKLVATGTQAVYQSVYVPWIGLAVLILAILILVASILRHNAAEAMHMAGWGFAVLVMVASVVALAVPLGRFADSGVSSFVNSVYATVDGSSQANGSAAGALEVDKILYPMWLDGELGSSTSKIAAEEGPKLYDANGYSWAQVGGAKLDVPKASVTAAKAKEWAHAAGIVKAADPDAYAHMTDVNAGRFAAGGMALIAAFLTAMFRIVADIMVLAALLKVRFAIIVTPAVGLLSVNERWSMLLRGLKDSVLRALVTCLAWSMASAVNIGFISLLLSPAVGLPLYVGVMLCGVVSVGLAMLLWRLGQMPSFTSASRFVARQRVRHRQQSRRDSGLAQSIGTAVAAAVGGGVGAAAAETVIEHHQDRQRDEGRPGEPVETDATTATPAASVDTEDNGETADPDRERDEGRVGEEMDDDNPLHPAVEPAPEPAVAAEEPEREEAVA